MPTLPPGWYPDQNTTGLLRYWDGQRWTAHTAPTHAVLPVARASAVQPSALPRWQSWWVIVPGLLLCFPIGLVGLWKRPGLPTSLRWILTGATAAFLLLALALPDQRPATTDDPPAASASPSETITERPSPDSEPADQESASAPTSEPPALALIPDLTGRSQDEVRAALEQAGLVLGEIATKPSRRAADTVLRQSVPAGTEAAPGTAVGVVLAIPLPVVPDVNGLREEQAVKQLQKAGFVVEVTTRVTRSGADGVVLSQTPGPDVGKRPGATVRIVIADVQIAPLAQPNCTSGYSPCLAPASDYDCAGGSGDGPRYVNGTVKVTGSDPYDLDRDGNGIGCD
ncbi:PASTA domain-containing protein [Nocardioides sp. LHD-245]|uniref:PASTA domain-containing protein n=1 Tax=Nocardioides sp. LHD-245 TaxID=3051387 RepID=UPI0027E00628|nr:PASTA domain-containing protein [Nocardioides sp. LHD-245]